MGHLVGHFGAPKQPKTNGFSQLWGKIDCSTASMASWLRSGPIWCQVGPTLAQERPIWPQAGPRWPSVGAPWTPPKGKSRLVSVILGVSCWTPKVTHPEWVTRGLGSQRPMGHLSGSLSGSLLGKKLPKNRWFSQLWGNHMKLFDYLTPILKSLKYHTQATIRDYLGNSHECR